LSLTPGTALGPYAIDAPLGAGGMGEVYRARDTRLGRDVAVKVIAAESATDPDRLARFEQEARAAAALNHPNILAVFDIGPGSAAHGPYIVSELLEGETLAARLARGRLPVRTAIELATQVARALAAAHDKGIVHRDLKPDNIFVTRDGTAKVLDFGLAKLRDASPGATSDASTVTGRPPTAQGAVMGTVGYMAPEQVRGADVDHRADIFAIGVTLYEMLAGQRAFSGDSGVETLNAILKSEPAEFETLGVPVPAEVARIVTHCLEKHPADRFQSARDLAFHLAGAAGSAGDTLRIVQAPDDAGSRPTRRPWVLPVGLAAAALSGALVTGGALLGSRTRWHARHHRVRDFERPVRTACSSRHGTLA
jgi:eukaryotic-like serine/threonine-protein kinase